MKPVYLLGIRFSKYLKFEAVLEPTSGLIPGQSTAKSRQNVPNYDIYISLSITDIQESKK